MKNLISKISLALILLSGAFLNAQAQDHNQVQQIALAEQAVDNDQAEKEEMIPSCQHSHEFDFMRIGLEYGQIIPNQQANINDNVTNIKGQSIGVNTEFFVKGRSFLIGTGAKVRMMSMNQAIVNDNSENNGQAAETQMFHEVNSLQIPLELKFRSPLLGQRSKINLSAGLAKDFHLFSNSFELENSENAGVRTKVDAQMKNQQFSATLGGGYELNLGTRSIEIGLSYQMDIDNNQRETSLSANQLNAQLSFYF